LVAICPACGSFSLPPASTYWWRHSACQPLHLCRYYYCCHFLRHLHHLPRLAVHWGAGAGQCWVRWRWVEPQPEHMGQGCPNCGWELDWPWGPGHLGVLLRWRPHCCQGWYSRQRQQVGGRRGRWAAQLGIGGAGCCGQAWSHFWLETAGRRDRGLRPSGPSIPLPTLASGSMVSNQSLLCPQLLWPSRISPGFNHLCA
jgi:hypothetical protein